MISTTHWILRALREYVLQAFVNCSSKKLGEEEVWGLASRHTLFVISKSHHARSNYMSHCKRIERDAYMQLCTVPAVER